MFLKLLAFTFLILMSAQPVALQAATQVGGSGNNLFCVQIDPDLFNEEMCAAAYLACLNGYTNGGFGPPSVVECPTMNGWCVCYDTDLGQGGDPAQCYQKYEQCLNNVNPPPPPPLE